MTNDIYNRPAVLPSEAVMLPAAESGDLGARPRNRPSLDTIRKNDARMTAARQAQMGGPAVPTMWIAPQQEPVHNEAQTQADKPPLWIGHAALRSITSGMPDVHPMPENTSNQPFAQTQAVEPQVSTRGALRSVVTGLLSGRGDQPGSFRQAPRVEQALALPSGQAINLPGPINPQA